MKKYTYRAERRMKMKDKNPGTAVLVIAGIVSAVFMTASAAAMSHLRTFVLAAFTAAIAAGALAFLFCHLRAFWVVFIPIGSAALSYFLGAGTGGILEMLCTVCFTAALCTIMAIKGSDTFRLLFASTLSFSAIFALFIIFRIDAMYGGFFEGVDGIIASLREELVNVISVSDIAESEASLIYTSIDSLLASASFLIPFGAFSLGMVAGWTMKGVVFLLGKLSDVTAPFFSFPSRAPGGLGIIYIISALVGIFVTPDSGAFYFVVMNLRSILMLLFIGEGIADLVRIIMMKGSSRSRVILIVLGAALLLFAFPLFLQFTSYLGAYCAISASRRRKRTGGNNA